LKAKLAKLKREQEEQHSRGGASSLGYDVKKSGDATVVLVGLPSVGKSTLLNKLTNAKSKVGAYQFTTLTVVPGVMEYRGARIQILDLPGIIEGAASGKGLGKRVLSVARSADLIMFLVDVFQPEAANVLKRELNNIGIRVDQKPPNIVIERTSSGGITVSAQVKLTKISEELVKEILHVYDVNSARVVIREDISDEQLVDVLLGNRVYIPSIAVMNKVDLVNVGFLHEIASKLDYKFVPISAEGNVNLTALKEEIYKSLGLIRIYMKPKGGETDFKEPLIVRKDSSVLDVCNKLHRKMKDDLRYAQIWGKSVKYGGQKVGISHRLMDEDIVTLIT
jgi:small GTP-binding protein